LNQDETNDLITQRDTDLETIFGSKIEKKSEIMSGVVIDPFRLSVIDRKLSAD